METVRRHTFVIVSFVAALGTITVASPAHAMGNSGASIRQAGIRENQNISQGSLADEVRKLRKEVDQLKAQQVTQNTGR